MLLAEKRVILSVLGLPLFSCAGVGRAELSLLQLAQSTGEAVQNPPPSASGLHVVHGTTLEVHNRERVLAKPLLCTRLEAVAF